MADSLIYAFSLLILEELQKLLPDTLGWTVSDLGSFSSYSYNNDIAALLISTRLPQSSQHFSYSLSVFDDCPDLLGGQLKVVGEHGFRVEVRYSPGLRVIQQPWERAYIGRPHLNCTLYYSKEPAKLCWPVGKEPPHELSPDDHYRALPLGRLQRGLMLVCRSIRGLIGDPDCQTLMAQKIYRAATGFLLGVPQLPDH